MKESIPSKSYEGNLNDIFLLDYSHPPLFLKIPLL